MQHLINNFDVAAYSSQKMLGIWYSFPDPLLLVAPTAHAGTYRGQHIGNRQFRGQHVGNRQFWSHKDPEFRKLVQRRFLDTSGASGVP